MRFLPLTTFFLCMSFVSFAYADESKTGFKVDNIKSIVPGKADTYPASSIVGSFGKELKLEYSVAFAEEKLTLYIFATNRLQKDASLTLSAKVTDSHGLVIGNGGGTVSLPSNSTRKTMGINIFMSKSILVPLLKSDISQPIFVEIQADEK